MKIANVIIEDICDFNDIRVMKRDFILTTTTNPEVAEIGVGDLIHFSYGTKGTATTEGVIVTDTPNEELYKVKFVDSKTDNDSLAIGFDKCILEKVNPCEVKAKKF